MATPTVIHLSSGAINLNGRGDWVSGTNYIKNDVVRRPSLGKTYLRKVTGAGTTPPESDTTNWMEFVTDGAPGINGTVGNTGPMGKSYIEYTVHVKGPLVTGEAPVGFPMLRAGRVLLSGLYSRLAPVGGPIVGTWSVDDISVHDAGEHPTIASGEHVSPVVATDPPLGSITPGDVLKFGVDLTGITADVSVALMDVVSSGSGTNTGAVPKNAAFVDTDLMVFAIVHGGLNTLDSSPTPVGYTSAGLWVSGMTVSAGQVARYDGQWYERLTAGPAGATNPSADTTNWRLVTNSWRRLLRASQSTTMTLEVFYKYATSDDPSSWTFGLTGSGSDFRAASMYRVRGMHATAPFATPATRSGTGGTTVVTPGVTPDGAANTVLSIMGLNGTGKTTTWHSSLTALQTTSRVPAAYRKLGSSAAPTNDVNNTLSVAETYVMAAIPIRPGSPVAENAGVDLTASCLVELDPV